jgi:hypothetical protein
MVRLKVRAGSIVWPPAIIPDFPAIQIGAAEASRFERCFGQLVSLIIITFIEENEFVLAWDGYNLSIA